MNTPDQAFHDAILRRRFDAFLHRAVMTLNPGTRYLPNWHLSAIAYQLERVRRGEVKRLSGPSSRLNRSHQRASCCTAAAG